MNGGLAQQAVQPQQGMSAPSQVTLSQVVQMLMEGATPSELVQAGVDPRMVERAVMEIQAQQQPQPSEAGLAGMYMGK